MYICRHIFRYHMNIELNPATKKWVSFYEVTPWSSLNDFKHISHWYGCSPVYALFYVVHGSPSIKP